MPPGDPMGGDMTHDPAIGPDMPPPPEGDMGEMHTHMDDAAAQGSMGPEGDMPPPPEGDMPMDDMPPPPADDPAGDDIV